MRTTVFQEAGGFAAVRRIVSDFYERVMTSPGLARHFAGVDLPRLIDHQTKFIVSVMGGPASFTPEHLRRAHAPLGVTHAEFDEVCLLLREALEDGEVQAATVDLVCARVAELRSCIVGSEAATGADGHAA
jgi:hemoglobin